MQRLTEYYDGEARAIRIDHKKAFAKLAAYEDTELIPEEVAELKIELIAIRSRFMDLKKILKEICTFFLNEWGCPFEFDDELELGFCIREEDEPCGHEKGWIECWKRYWAMKAREAIES